MSAYSGIAHVPKYNPRAGRDNPAGKGQLPRELFKFVLSEFDQASQIPKCAMQKLFVSIVLLFTFFSVIGADAEPDEETAADFIGTWHVTSATNSMILSIKPEGEALFILIQKFLTWS